MLHDDVYNLKAIKKDTFNVGNSYILSIPKCVFVDLLFGKIARSTLNR